MEVVAANLEQVVNQPDDLDARGQMMLAAAYAGIGFGNAGVHLPHGMSYPVSGLVRSFVPEGYPGDHAIVPHGMSVILNAPAVFRFTAQANPQRHLEAARMLGADIRDAGPDDAGEVLSGKLIDIMRRTGHAQWLERGWLYRSGCRSTRGRHDSAAPGDQAFTPSSV